MAEIARKTQVITGVAPDRIPVAELLEAGTTGDPQGTGARLAAGSQRARISRAGHRLSEAVLRAQRPSPFSAGAPTIAGRFHYNDELTGFNFQAQKVPLGDTLDRLQAQLGDANAPSVYVGSTDIDLYLPQLRWRTISYLNGRSFEHHRPIMSIWIGNRTVASAHFDMTHNLACCMVGRRRFLAVSSGAGAQPVSRTARADAGRAGGQHGEFRRAGFRALSAVPRSARRGPGGGDRARRCAVLSGHVVAPRPGAGILQHHDQLLVDHVTQIHRFSAYHAHACADQPA